MRELEARDIESAVEKAFVDANIHLPEQVVGRLKIASEEEVSPEGKEVLDELLANARIAREENIPICQDTGLAVLFLEIGQDVHVTGGYLIDAITEGVRRAYLKGYLRKSCCDPFTRTNTGDNTPAIIHTSVVRGDRIRIVAMPKGGGSENCSALRMLTPSEGIEGVIDFVVETVKKAGPNPCPPITVGVGVGGNLETSALLSKEALMIPFNQRNPEPYLGDLELRIVNEINKLGIGPGGYGGRVTALDAHIKVQACHIASLPVSVNIQCHAHRFSEVTL